MKTKVRILVAVLLALGMVGINSARPTYAANDMVTNCSGDPTVPGSLPYEVGTAAAGDTLTFGQDCPSSGPITLSSVISISKNLTIDGTGHSIVIDGAGVTQLFTVTGSPSAFTFLTLKGLTLAHGAGATGGAIHNTDYGWVIITNSTFSNNSATSQGGAIYNSGLDGTVNITGSTFSGNSAPSGGAIYNTSIFRSVTIAGSTFSGNSATSQGGAIYNGVSNLTVSGSSSFSGNSSSSGGAVYNLGDVTIQSGSTLSGNSASSGGAIYNTGVYSNLSIQGSTLSGNSTSCGGFGCTSGGAAIYNFQGIANITSSTLSGNTSTCSGGTFCSGNGGAIYNSQGSTAIATSTLAGNSATSGGAVYSSGTMTITNSTLAGNSASFGGAIDNGDLLYMSGSIVANTNGGNCGHYSVSDNGYNLEWSGTGNGNTCGFSTANHDITGQDPLLTSLADNGGPTQTMALQPGSPAMDRISAGSAGCPTAPTVGTDQRGAGHPRPDVEDTDGSCDIGAFELTPPPDTTAPTTSATATNADNSSYTFGNWTHQAVSVMLVATDNASGSGVAQTYYGWEDSGCSTSALTLCSTGTSTSISTAGTHTLTYFSSDNAGNIETANTASVNIDTTSPTSSIQCNSATCSSSTYSGPVSVTLSATDAGGSGLKEIRFTTDGTTVPDATHGTVYSGSAFTVSSTATVQYAAIDNAGNVESANSQTITIQTSTGLMPGAVTGTYGGTADLSATLSPAVSGKTVTFYLNGTQVCGGTTGAVCPATDVVGVASLTGVNLSGIGAGTYGDAGTCDSTHGVYASFSGDSNYTGSHGCNSLSVAKKDVHVTASAAAVTYGDAPPSGFTITYAGDFVGSDTASSVVGSNAPTCSTSYTNSSSVSGSPYAISCTIGSLQATNYRFVSGYSGTSGTPLSSNPTQLGALVVNKARGSVSINNIPSSAAYGGSFTPIYATLGDGTASTVSNSPTVCAVNSGTGVVNFVTTGICKLQASAVEGTNYLAATGTEQSFTVGKAATTTTLTSAANPATVGQAVIFTAKVVPTTGSAIPAGTVTFKDGSATLGTGTLSTVAGVATATYTTSKLALGVHSLTAVYGGSTNIVGSTASALAQYVDTSLSGYPKLPGGAYNLAKATLAGAYLADANLAGASITSANLSGSTLMYATITNADLTKANVSTGNLSYADLSNSNLTGANFSNSNLTSAALVGANLSSANFSSATLTNANLSNANLTGANFTGAKGMKTATLVGVIWSKTTCPDGTNSSNDGGTCVGHL